MRSTVELPGTVAPFEQSSVPSNTSLPARVKKVYVKEGDYVRAGAKLLDLDFTDIITQLEQQQSILEGSSARQDQAKTGYSYQKDQTSSAIRTASANLKASSIRYDQARKNLALTRKQSDAQASAARATLEQAEANLRRLQAGFREQEVEQAKAAVAQSEGALAAAQANLRKLKVGPRPQEIQAAQAQMDQAQAAVEQAKANLKKVQAGARIQELAQAKAAVASAKSTLDKAKKDLDRARNLFEKGAIPAQQRDAAQNAYDVAQAQYERTVEAYDLMKEGARAEDIEAAKMQVAEAEAGLRRARESHDLLKEGTRREDIDAAQSQVDQAAAALEKARQSYNLLKEGTRKEDIDAAQAQVRQAKAALDLALSNADQVKIREDDVSAAKTSLSQAKIAYDLALAGRKQNTMSSDAVRASQAAVAQAKAALELARNQMKNTSLLAPLGGLVTKKSINEGEIPGKEPLFEISNIDPVLVEVFADIRYISDIHTGQQAEFRFDVIPGRIFTGFVKEINPSADPSNKTFKVRIQVSNPQHRLQPGMYAMSKIHIASKPDALVIPADAIQSRNDRKICFIADGDASRMVEVKTGLKTRETIEVVSGLRAGDRVIIQGAEKFVGGEKISIEGGTAGTGKKEPTR
jgi:RND family efflux transporter MFP subunit